MKFVIDINPDNIVRQFSSHDNPNAISCDDLVQFFIEAFVDGMLDALEARYPDFSLDRAEIGPRLLNWCKNNFKAIPDSLKDKISECLEQVNSRKPDKFISTIDKLSQTICNPCENSRFLDGEEHSAFVGCDKRGKKVFVYLTIDVQKIKQFISFSDDSILAPEIRAVHDAVISLYLEGNVHITPDMIYSTLNGNNTTRQVPAGFKKFLTEAMNKLMYTGIKIDASEEAKAFGIQNFQFKGYVLPMTYSLATINGVTRECWKILEKPPLLSFAERKNQIASCEISALDTGLYTTPENITLTHYLIDRVLIMQNQAEHAKKARGKSKPKVNTSIAYDTIYKYLGIKAPNENALKQEKAKVRKKVKDILDVWVKTGFIASYGEILDGKKITGVDIVIASNNKKQ